MVQYMYRAPMNATVHGNHILYGYGTDATYAISPSRWTAGDIIGVALYIWLVISSMFFTSMRGGWFLGLVSAITLVIALAVFHITWTSVWCFFEAIVSLIILWMVYTEMKMLR